MANAKSGASDKTLIRFNVQNIKYAMRKSDGTYETPVSYGTALKMALEADTSVKKIFGDGRRIASIVNDKGKTGAMTTNNISDDFEIAVGRAIKTAVGLATIKQQKNVEFALYFEVCGLKENGNMPLCKSWLYGVTSPTPPSESYDQNTDDINESSFETALEIAGTELKGKDGKVWKDDETGQDVIVWKLTVDPSDSGYATFGDAVVLPTMETAQSGEAVAATETHND